MPIDPIDLLTSGNTPELRRVRDLDNHYHVEMIAKDSSQIAAYQREALKLQYQAAATNLRALAEIASRQDETNELLSGILGGIDYMCDSLDALNATAERTLDALKEGFSTIANHLMEQKKSLDQISYDIRHPYEKQMMELAEAADSILKEGMASDGRDRDERYKHASGLLDKVLENPIGHLNYVAWFQTGWLRWKFESNYRSAEEAFYQAALLSANKARLYHVLSLRHLAYMQYQQKKYEEAYSTIQKAVADAPNDHNVLYDAARYAAKTGRVDEAISLLDKCIDLEPQTVVAMFAEEDFLA